MYTGNLLYVSYLSVSGEDRWMCTLMMMHGWKLRYSSYGTNSTYCPDNTDEFMKQRRRWVLSDFANTLLVLKNLPGLIRQNPCFTLVNAFYLLQLFLICVLSSGSTIGLIAIGLNLVFKIPHVIVSVVLTIMLVAYGCVCYVKSLSHLIKFTTKAMMVILGLCAVCVTVGTTVRIIQDILRGKLSLPLSLSLIQYILRA